MFTLSLLIIWCTVFALLVHNVDAALNCVRDPQPVPNVHNYKRVSPYSIEGFGDQYPLKYHMMQKGFFIDNDDVYRHINPVGFVNLFRKLACGEPVTVAVYGGSFTSGHGLNKPEIPWQSLFLGWLRTEYPLSNIFHINGAIPSSSSPMGYSHFHEKLLKNVTIDLCLFDFSMNDNVLAHKDGRTETDPTILLATTENVMRLAAAHNIALIYLSVSMKDPVCDTVYNTVARTYGVPLLSYRHAVIDNMTEAATMKVYNPDYHMAGTTLSVFYPHPRDPHPPFCVHVLLADFVAYATSLLHHGVHRLHYEQPAAAEVGEKFVFAPKFGGIDDAETTDNDDMASQMRACFPASLSLSSLNNDSGATSLEHVLHDTGWSYAADVPGKPLGWIAGGRTRPTHGGKLTLQKLWIPGVFIQGRVTITYLQSYENSGIFQLFLGGRVYLEVGAYTPTSPLRRKDFPNIIPCCNASSFSKYSTESAFVDTYSSVEKHSAVIEKTFHFDVVGKSDLWIVFVPLSDHNFNIRGGDKVKIMGVTLC